MDRSPKLMIPSVNLQRVSTVAWILVVWTTSAYCRETFLLACGQDQDGKGASLYWAPINTEQFTKIPLAINGIPEDVTFDPVDEKIYWIERTVQNSKLEAGLNGNKESCSLTTRICRTDFGGTNVEIIVNDQVASVAVCNAPASQIAIDVTSRYLYWLSSNIEGFIELKKTSIEDARKTTLIAMKRQSLTTDIAVDSRNRKLIWSVSIPAPAAILRMDLNGTNNYEIIIDQEWGISGVTFDTSDSQLYLTASRGSHILRRTDESGSNVRILYTDDKNLDARNPAVSDDDIYWTMADMLEPGESRHLFRMPKSGGQTPIKVNTGFNVQCLHIHRTEDRFRSNHSALTWVRQGLSTPSPIFYADPTSIPLLKAEEEDDPRSDFNSSFIGDGLKRILILSGFGILLLLTVLLVCLLVCMVLRKRGRNQDAYDAVETAGDQPDVVDNDLSKELNNNNERGSVFLEREVEREKVQIANQVGTGFFGVVYKAYYVQDNVTTCVAVKTLKDDVSSEVKERFLEEIKLQMEIGSHPNILSVLGCVTINEPYYMITEFMKYGDLLNFLWKCNKEENVLQDIIYDLSKVDQLHIARQIAQGMEYLSTTRCYHGDLAARNILVGEDLLVKISDFGMADDIYTEGYMRIAPERKRPVKWVSLETNMQGRCTIKSDVWSYGIVLYEIYTLGGTPYPGMTCQEVIVSLNQGFRMQKCDGCPDQIYNIMLQCWDKNPSDRPSFTALLRTIGQMIERDSKPGRHDYQNVCPDEPIRRASQISYDDDAFVPPYVQITDEKGLSTNPQINGSYRDRIGSGENDEHNLWKHLTKPHKTSSSSVEFVPAEKMHGNEGDTRTLPDAVPVVGNKYQVPTFV